MRTIRKLGIHNQYILTNIVENFRNQKEASTFLLLMIVTANAVNNLENVVSNSKDFRITNKAVYVSAAHSSYISSLELQIKDINSLCLMFWPVAVTNNCTL